MDDTLRIVAVEAHNAKRILHNSPPVQYSLDIEQQAQKWADHLIATNKFEHSNTKYGENLMMGGTSSKTPIDKARTIKNAVEMFYGEIKAYKEPKFKMTTGHFTQVVWKASSRIGVGIASSNGKVVVVINYNPPGNMAGHFKQNVIMPPIMPKSLADVCQDDESYSDLVDVVIL